MNSSVHLIPFGLSIIDQNWGGIYRGGSYLAIGPRKSGRTLLGLQYALEAAKAQEVCLYFTNMRPKDLMIQAASINFDIQSYMNQNLIIVVRVAPPNDIYEMANPDGALVEYLNDILTVVNQYEPSRIIFDELTPYIGFRNIGLLRDSFLRTIETIEDRDITSLFVVSEPATERAQLIVDTLAQFCTGIIFLKKDITKGLYHGGKIIISPNVGHNEGQFSSKYSIQPYKGITIVSEETPQSPKLKVFDSPDATNVHEIKQEHPRVENKIEQMKESKKTSSPDMLAFSNFYNESDFKLILNNQIALYRSTGQKFAILTLKLDQTAQAKGLISMNQLLNTIKLSTEKKDKICSVENKIIILIARSTENSIINVSNKIKSNLPINDPAYVANTLEYISVLSIEVNETVTSADSIMNYLLIGENGDSNYVALNKFTG
ncbi:MAG: RAD55 family ATPase [Ignavibacteria bacterium]